MLDGTAIDTDWCKGFAEGADKITALNDKTVAEDVYKRQLLVKWLPKVSFWRIQTGMSA